MLLARTYSHFSLLSAIPQLPALIADAKSKGYTSIALCDEDTTSGLIEFYELCKKEDIKPVLGTSLHITSVLHPQGQFTSSQEITSTISLLAKNEAGYKAILELVSLARTQKEDPVYHIDIEDLLAYKDASGNMPFFVLLHFDTHEYSMHLRNGSQTTADTILSAYVSKLGHEHIIVELLLPFFNDDVSHIQQCNEWLTSWAITERVSCVASPAPRHINPDDAEAYQVVQAIKKQVRKYDIELERDYHTPSVEELKAQCTAFPHVCDTQLIEDAIDITIRTDYDKYASEAFFPYFELPEGQDYVGRLYWDVYIGLFTKLHPSQKSEHEWRQQFPYESLHELKKEASTIEPSVHTLKGYPSDYWEKKSIQDYIARVEYELDIINSKGYPSYFLVFADIMRFSRENGIVINTRGSAAGSLVGYLTGINILDPLVYNLPFERFLNPYRPSAPDIDGDFADDRRQEVIQYLVDKYGRDNVSQIITFGTMLPRAAVRDIGRVLGVAYRKCDQLSKLIPIAPQGRKATFEWAFATSAELSQVYEKDSEVKQIIDIAKRIQGNYRHASVHAAGVIITPTKLTDYCAVQWDSDHTQVACQFDMRNAEKVGLVKMDILGITNLSILGNAVKLTKQRRGVDVDLYHLDLENENAFRLLANGKTIGLFQLSSPAMTRYLVQLEPTKVTDLMAMVALYRPGAMANIPDYIKRKKNPSLITYLVPQMKEWMESSYGLFVYQEDLLYTAVELAGYNWGDVDVLRKAMGKKIKKIIDEQEPIFVQGAIEKSNITKQKAEEIWALMVPFGAYGFNKSHSSNYGMVAYMTAYMKANYPAEFMTALMTSEEGNMDKISSAIKECIEMGITVLPPDVNTSFAGYTIQDDTTIRYGLGSVKNLGSDIISYIISNRESEGEFTSVTNFISRMSKLQSFNKRSLEALIQSGALDTIATQELMV